MEHHVRLCLTCGESADPTDKFCSRCGSEILSPDGPAAKGTGTGHAEELDITSGGKAVSPAAPFTAQAEDLVAQRRRPKRRRLLIASIAGAAGVALIVALVFVRMRDSPSAGVSSAGASSAGASSAGASSAGASPSPRTAVPDFPYGSDPAAIAAAGGIENFSALDPAAAEGFSKGGGTYSGVYVSVTAFDTEVDQRQQLDPLKEAYEKGPVGRTERILNGPSWIVQVSDNYLDR